MRMIGRMPAAALAALLSAGLAACASGSNHNAEGQDGGAGAGSTVSGNDTAVTVHYSSGAAGGSDLVPAAAPSPSTSAGSATGAATAGSPGAPGAITTTSPGNPATQPPAPAGGQAPASTNDTVRHQ
jgi:hypothetical protein